MLTLYSMRRSGNCYKVRLALAQLRLPFHLTEIDILKGESRTPDFLAKNPSGHVPLGFLARKSGVRLSPLRMSISVRWNGSLSWASASRTL